jgi:hypothetical protein
MTITLNGTTGISNDGGYTGDGILFADTTPSNTLVTTTGGNVGVGTASPGVKLDVTGAVRSLVSGGIPIFYLNNGTTQHSIQNTSGALTFFIDGTERARIDTNGNLLVGTTSNVGAPARSVAIGTSTYGALAAEAPGSGGGYPVWFRDTDATSASQQIVHFRRGASNVGSITTTNTATAYNTSSDYRLKEQVQPMTGSLSVVQQLKPCTYKWKADGSDGQGFIAHELAEVVPECVSGEKDAVDAEGNPQYQGIDVSFLVATLTAAIQELKAIVDAQGAEIAALKGAQ